MDYYLKKHMPLVQERWGSYGLKSWKVNQIGGDAPYSVCCLLDFESVEAFQKAAEGPETKEVLADVKNFTSAEPILMPGNIVGTS